MIVMDLVDLEHCGVDHEEFKSELSLIDRTLKPIEDLSENSINNFGDYGYGRFKEFQTDYKKGWNFGEGKALSEYSIALIDLFLEKFSTFPTEPSIFLTTEGYLQLIWEDKYGQEIVIEFTHTSFIYYIERLNEEGEIQIEAIKTLIAKMKNLIRRGLVDGCDCGCRGDFEITRKGVAYIESRHHNNHMQQIKTAVQS